jgi:hypothetical protein
MCKHQADLLQHHGVLLLTAIGFRTQRCCCNLSDCGLASGARLVKLQQLLPRHWPHKPRMTRNGICSGYFTIYRES